MLELADDASSVLASTRTSPLGFLGWTCRQPSFLRLLQVQLAALPLARLVVVSRRRLSQPPREGLVPQFLPVRCRQNVGDMLLVISSFFAHRTGGSATMFFDFPLCDVGAAMHWCITDYSFGFDGVFAMFDQQFLAESLVVRRR